jgi:hypothetical protein
MFSRFQNLISGGCSFTYDGIGGVPPSAAESGGNSFVPDVSYEVREPNTWASRIAQQFRPRSFVNVAASSHGNILTALAIQYLLDNYDYRPENTLILFNITDPCRLDIPCEHTNNESSKYVPWSSEIIPFSFLSMASPSLNQFTNRCGLRPHRCQQENFPRLPHVTSSILMSLLYRLREQGFDFAFVCMRDYETTPGLDKILDNFESNFIPMGSESGMLEYCIKHSLTISTSDTHPNDAGHAMIANKVSHYLIANKLL